MKMENNICCLCKSARFIKIKNVLRDGTKRYKVARCAKCSHVQLIPKPSAEDDKEFYDKNMQDKQRNKRIDLNILRTHNLFDTLRHVEQIKKITKNKNARILDVGSRYGFFLDALYKEGYKNIAGIEVSRDRREMAQKYVKAPILNVDINCAHNNIGVFDIITIFHVVEHMADPVSFLRNAAKLLAKNGVIIVEVPNVIELLLETNRAYNDFYWIRAHLNYFSAKTLRICMKKSGLRSIKISNNQRYGLVNLFNWIINQKPQIDKPVFEIDKPYNLLEENYKKYLEETGRADTLVAFGRTH